MNMSTISQQLRLNMTKIFAFIDIIKILSPQFTYYILQEYYILYCIYTRIYVYLGNMI